MAILKPFKAWRPKSDYVRDIVCVPYDVIDTQDARSLVEDNKQTFLHVVRPEVDLPKNTSVYDDKVYEQGKLNLKRLLSSNVFLQEEESCLYIYRIIWEENTQTGIFGCVSAEDYNSNIILKHERTRPDKEDDRTRHIISQKAHAEPVMITYKDTEQISEYISEFIQNNKALFHFDTDDGITHTLWRLENSDELSQRFQNIPKLYIADGHHRCASAARAAKEMAKSNANHTGTEDYNFFPAVLFPLNEMKILAYNRIIYSVRKDFIEILSKKFKLIENASPVPAKKGDISFYFQDKWYGFTLSETKHKDPASNLDIAKLQDQVFEPLLGITNQRTDSNINFVGGIKGTDELERLVDDGEADLAVSLFPTGIEELIAVSDAGLLMPPKSTWFEPKLRSGLLVHTF